MINPSTIICVILFFYCFVVFSRKKSKPKQYVRPLHMCDICNGTGNGKTPRTANLKDKVKCIACNGEGILRK